MRSRQCGDGSWSSYWWLSPHYTTLQAVEFALAAGDRAAVRRAVLWAMVTQRDSGGWGEVGAADSAFASALAVSICLRANADHDYLERGVMRLIELQQADGGWVAIRSCGSRYRPTGTPTGTARGGRCVSGTASS